jgi:hypothetical protein
MARTLTTKAGHALILRMKSPIGPPRGIEIDHEQSALASGPGTEVAARATDSMKT